MRVTSFLALCAAAFAAAFGYTAVMPLLPQLLTPLLSQASSLAVGWHAGAYAAIYMFAVVLFAPAWGAASDRYGVKIVITTGLAGSAVGAFAANFTEALWNVYLARALQGAFAAAILPAANAMLTQITDTAERARKVTTLGIASLLGFFTAPTLSAAAVSFLAGDPVKRAQYASGLVALIALCIVIAMLSQAGGRNNHIAAQEVKVLSWRFLGLNFIAYLGLGAFEVALPLAAGESLAMDPAQVSLLFAECSLAMLVAQILLIWGARFRARFEQALVIAIAIYGAGLLLLSGASTIIGATVAVGLIAAASGLVLPMVVYLAMLQIGTRPGAALGALTAAGGLGQALGAVGGGVLYGYAGVSVFMLTGFAIALGAWLASPGCAPRWLGGQNQCVNVRKTGE